MEKHDKHKLFVQILKNLLFFIKKQIVLILVIIMDFVLMENVYVMMGLKKILIVKQLKMFLII